MAKKAPDKPTFVHPYTYHIYTDGSFRPLNASAACSYLIFSERTKHIVKMASHSFRGKTINQMELMAISLGLDHPGMDHVVIYSDSDYSIMCLTLWYKTWIKNNWCDRDGNPVKNKDLIISILDKIKTKKFVRFVKIKAHTGDPFNSVVDHLASNLTKRMTEDLSYPDKEHIH